MGSFALMSWTLYTFYSSGPESVGYRPYRVFIPPRNKSPHPPLNYIFPNIVRLCKKDIGGSLLLGGSWDLVSN